MGVHVLCAHYFYLRVIIMEYVLEIKQILEYARVRMYRELIQKLMADRSLSYRGTSNLFSFMVLCSYANFRSCRKRIDGISYLIGPGEWICNLRDIAGWFRQRRLYEAEEILYQLAERGFISYEFLPGRKMLRYRILNWDKFNTVLEYECRSHKDCGFFFFPICYAEKLIDGKTCSELDAVMDLWLNTIYMDERVKGSDLGPVVYFRNTTGDPVTSYSNMAQRWGRSKATVFRFIRKLEGMGYITSLNFSGSHGSIIYLNNYLSTMFSISDVPVDKSEVAFALRLRVKVEEKSPSPEQNNANNSVSKEKNTVSKEVVQVLAERVLQMLSQCGFSCCGCEKKAAKLYILSAYGEFALEVICRKRRRAGATKSTYRFAVKIVDSSG